MSEHQIFIDEKNRLDVLLEKGYKIKNVMENLSGTFIELKSDDKLSEETVRLHLTTANARKYFSVKLIEQSFIK
ncbi:hypothetical protein [Bacillus massiliigorillae]|uniref:hypothetical protein n=1 Tax=Bacillus massiliigorillae TaxID=1243664 RepID=UPI0003A3ED3B|nr:hypothetical protein [Bacillus massiliigorillae]